jgi:ABC-type transport system involved in cytochrome c biogenesis permease component
MNMRLILLVGVPALAVVGAAVVALVLIFGRRGPPDD